MPENRITYLRHDDIDTARWDAAVDHACNGMIYGYSWFISGMAGKQWDAIILNDYEAVFPLPWKKKFGIAYLYQPYFIQQLGIFSLLPLTTEVLWQMIDAIPKKFRLWEISLNSMNQVFRPDITLINRTTYRLDLHKPYIDLYDNYRADAKKNLAKTFDNHLEYTHRLGMTDVVSYYRQAYGALNPHVPDSVYEQILQLGNEALRRGKAELAGVKNASGELLAAALFLISHNTAHYVLGAPSESGKMLGATHVLIDGFIKHHANTEMILDFEGSDIESVAYFYRKFGSSASHYYFLQRNRLPFWAKLLRR